MFLARKLRSGKGKHYRKSLILILFVSSIPGLIIGAIVYWVVGGRIESELNVLHNRQIQLRAGNIDDQLENIELMLSHWAFDPKFDYSLAGRNLVKEFDRSRDITKTLLVMQGSSTLTKRVELYLDERAGMPPTLFAPEYDALKQPETIANYARLLESNRPTYWMQWAPDPAHPGQKDLTLVHQVPGGSTQPFGVLLVRLDALKVSNLIKTMTPYNDGEAFLISESGDLIASTGDQNGPTPLAQALQKEIAARSERQGSFFYTWDRVTYTVSYGLFDRIGTNWMYVSAAPITSITAPVVSVSKMILAVSSAVLLLAVCLAWLASRRIYSPVRQLVQNMLGGKSEIVPANDDEFKLIEREWQYLSRESRELQAKLERQLPHVKESFLLQLVQGYLFAYSEDDLRERMKHYNWDVDDCTFVVAYIRLTGFTLLEGRFSQGDEGLVTFAAVNMIEEMSARRFAQSDVLNFHDLSAGLFLAVPGTEDLGRELRALAEELTQAINQLLKLRVTIVIGRPTRQIAHIPHLFEEAKQVIGYRMFERNNQVIEMERYDRAESPTDIRYPFALEREIVQALRTGREQETIDGLEAFLEALSGPGATEIDVRQGMLHLLGSLLHAMLGSGVNPNCLFKGANPYELLSQIREPEHMLSWFRDKLVAPFLRKLEERTDAQVKRIVEQAVVYLQNNYMKDISLDSCADHTGTNPYFLSKAFKQITGRNFIDTLTEIRLEKAKELLRESECKINVVAELVGYQHTYFNRIFKKLEGVTPGQYREMSRAGEP